MSTLTTNYKFIKPQRSDAADIEATNPNWDVVDAQLKALNDDLDDANDTLQTKITYGTSTPSGGNHGDVYIQLVE